MGMSSRYHKIDGWRGYRIPGAAVAGASCTGGWSDSIARPEAVKAELAGLRQVLKQAGIGSRLRVGMTSNVFCAKVWVTVAPRQWEEAVKLATTYLAEHKQDTRYIHDAF